MLILHLWNVSRKRLRTHSGTQQRQSPRRILPEKGSLLCWSAHTYLRTVFSSFYSWSIKNKHVFLVAYPNTDLPPVHPFDILYKRNKKKTISIRSNTIFDVFTVRTASAAGLSVLCLFSCAVNHTMLTPENASNIHTYPSHRCEFKWATCFLLNLKRCIFFYFKNSWLKSNTCSFLRGFTIAQ